MIIFLITTVILNTFFFILHKNIANYFNVFDYPDKVRKFMEIRQLQVDY